MKREERESDEYWTTIALSTHKKKDTYCSCKESEKVTQSFWCLVHLSKLESISNVRVTQRFWRVDATAKRHHTRDPGIVIVAAVA